MMAPCQQNNPDSSHIANARELSTDCVFWTATSGISNLQSEHHRRCTRLHPEPPRVSC